MRERKGVKPVEYMDVHQAAERWQVPERKVTALCREGRIPGARKSGKLWLLPEKALRPLDGRTKEYAAARERGEVSFAPDAAGKVLDFGVSNQNPAMMSRLAHYLPFPIAANQVQISAAFTPMFDAFFNANMENDAAVMRDGGILEYCYDHDMAVQAWSVLQHGYFGGVFLDNPDYAELNEALERIAADHDTTKTAVAINWVLRYPAKMQALVGTTRPERIRQSAAACDWEMTREEWYEVYLSAGHQLP